MKTVIDQRRFNCVAAATVVILTRETFKGLCSVGGQAFDQSDYECSKEDTCSHASSAECRVRQLNGVSNDCS